MRWILVCADDREWDRRLLFVVRFVLFGSMGIFLLSIDLFGFASKTEQLSQDLYVTIVAPFVDGLPAEDPRDPTVVLFDDHSLAMEGGDWPVHYGYHAKVLAAIIRHCPRQLFVDFEFGRNTGKTLAEREFFNRTLLPVLEDARNEGGDFDCPSLANKENILYAQGSASADTGAPTPLALSDFGRPTNVSWVMEPGFYAVRIDGRRFIGDSARQPASAALQLYRALHPAEAADAAFEESDFRHKMALRWHLAPPADQHFFTRIDLLIDPRGSDGGDRPACLDAPHPDYGALGSLGYLFVRGVFGDLRMRDPVPIQACPPIRTVKAESLYYNQFDPEVFDAAFRGRTVMYGANVAAAPDLHQSPLHGRISGVYFHAQAFENLQEMGADYVHAPPWLKDALEYGIWVILVFILCIRLDRRTRWSTGTTAGSGEVGEHWPIRLMLLDEHDKWRETRRTILVFATTSVTVFLACFWLNLPMADLVGLATLRGMAAVFVELGLVGLILERLPQFRDLR